MKIYVVVTDDHYNPHAPAERILGCKLFIDKKKLKIIIMASNTNIQLDGMLLIYM